MINTYPVKGLLQCVADGTIPPAEATARIGNYMRMIEVKAKAEMKLEFINKAYKSHQALCDMEPERDAVSYSKSEALHLLLNTPTEGREG